MSDTPIDGGPAFPSDFVELPNSGFSKGMTLRDYFAAAALPALVTSALEENHKVWDATAAHAYIIADAMLEARKREQE